MAMAAGVATLIRLRRTEVVEKVGEFDCQLEESLEKVKLSDTVA